MFALKMRKITLKCYIISNLVIAAMFINAVSAFVVSRKL